MMERRCEWGLLYLTYLDRKNRLRTHESLGKRPSEGVALPLCHKMEQGGFWPSPYELVSLFDVLDFYAYQFIQTIYLIYRVREIVESYDKHGGQSKYNNPLAAAVAGEEYKPSSKYIPDDIKEAIVITIKQLKEHCDSAQLTITGKQINRLATDITLPTFTFADAKYAIDHILNVVGDELEDRCFVYIPKERASYWKEPFPFGEELSIKLADLDWEIEEASKSLAAGRGTACVFHLMRILEAILIKLGKVFAVSVGRENWQPLIDRIESKISEMGKQKDKPANWKEEQEYYSQAISYLATVKNAWRNYTAHVRGKYTPEEAEQMFKNVRSFVKMISDKYKVKCTPRRVDKKPGPKTVYVKAHTKSTPKPLPKKCR